MPTPHRTRRLLVAGTAAAAVLLLGPWAYRCADGLSLVIRGANLQGAVRRLADSWTVPHAERSVQMDVGTESILARVYTPGQASRQTVLLVSGLHAAGIDEPRLTALARELARSGVTVVTPDIAELSRFEITPSLTDRIEQAALWLAGRSDLSPSGRIGLMGISFSGGLSVVAAGRPSLNDRLSYVFAFGGHDDLPRVLEYLCTGEIGSPAGLTGGQDGTRVRAPPHDYGVAVVLLNVAHHLVPAEQAAPLREAVQRFLHASHLDVVDKPAAEREFAALRALALELPEPSATLLDRVNRRAVADLGPQLLPHLTAHAEPPALSPARSPAPSVPVFLLHGRDDTVIPSAESVSLAERRRGQQMPVRLLLTDLVSHAEADRQAGALEVLRLASFWGDLLAR